MSQLGDTNRPSCSMAERSVAVDCIRRQEVVRLFKQGKVIDALVMLADQRIDLTVPKEDGFSMLHSVSIYGSKEAVDFLWERGARPSIVKLDNSTLLHSAVRCHERCEERARVVEFFLNSAQSFPNLLDVNHRTNKGWTALKLAVKKDLERCVELLLEHGADPDIPDLEGYYPLHNAVGSHDITKLLLTKVKNVDCQTCDGETALFLSAQKGLVESSLMLLEHNANPNIANKENISPLFLAARAGHLELVKALVSKGANTNMVGAQQNVGPLHWAAHKEMEAIALFLIEHGGDVMLADKEGRTPLSMASPELASKMLMAAQKANPCISVVTCDTPMSAEEKAMAAACSGNVPALQSLLSAGVSVNYVNDANKGASLLHMAAYCGQPNIVFCLMNEGADWRAVDAVGDTVLHFACIKEVPCGRHDQTLEYLMSTPARTLKDSCNKRGDTPIFLAARSHLVSRMKILLKHGVDANIANSKKELPLHKACTSDRNIEALLFLAECCPDINLHDGDGWTPLMYATKCKAASVVKYLLQRGASANVCHPQGYSPLYLSIQEDNTAVCEILLRAKADPGAVCGSRDHTPLHLAASKDLRTLCLMLMQHGASVNARDNQGNTPIDLAASVELRQAMEAFANGRDANIGITSEESLFQLSIQQETSNLLQNSCPNNTSSRCHQSIGAAPPTTCHQSNGAAPPTTCHQSNGAAPPTTCHQSNGAAPPTTCHQSNGSAPPTTCHQSNGSAPPTTCHQSNGAAPPTTCHQSNGAAPPTTCHQSNGAAPPTTCHQSNGSAPPTTCHQSNGSAPPTTCHQSNGAAPPTTCHQSNGAAPPTTCHQSNGSAPPTTCHQSNGSAPPTTCHQSNGSAPPTTCHQSNGAAPPTTCHQSNGAAPPTTCHQSNGSAPPTTCHQSNGSAPPTTCHQSNGAAPPTMCTRLQAAVTNFMSRGSGMPTMGTSLCSQLRDNVVPFRSKRSPTQQTSIPVCSQKGNTPLPVCSQKGNTSIPVCNDTNELKRSGEERTEEREKVCKLQEELQLRDKEICKLRHEIQSLTQEREQLLCSDRQEEPTSLNERKDTEVMDPWWKVDQDSLELAGELLNKDSYPAARFYHVWQGQFRSMDVAVKCVADVSSWSKQVYTAFGQDVERISHLQCPNIVQFLGACIDPCRRVATVIVEYMSRGNLHSLLHVDHTHLEWRTKLKILQDICGGMAYLHSLSMLHQMLTPRNILIGEHFNAKISDIGFCETKTQSNYYNTLQALMAQCPSPRIYTAPEVIEASQFSPASDVYSFGILLCEMATGEKPYADTPCPTILTIKVIMGHRPTLACNVPSAYQKLAVECWNGDMNMRPTFRYALGELNKLYAETNPVQLYTNCK